VTDVVIVPGDDAEQVARDLLSLAESKHDVRTTSDHGLAFIVPERLALAYQELMSEITVPAVVPDPVAPKRRGRARKEIADGE
jgi:hypothetical protein